MSANAKRKFRRGWPIRGYVGPNGSGKSACAVLDLVPSLRTGRPVLSTVRLLDGDNPRPCEDPHCGHAEHSMGVEVTHRQSHPLWIPFTDWSQLLEAERCDVLMDEVTGVASSRDSMNMPSVVANSLVQMRRADVTVLWTAPSWARADKIIRECSQAVVHCEGSFPKRHEDETRAWSNRRLSRWSTYDAQSFEEFTVGKRQQLRPMNRQHCWLPRSGAFDWYDSFDSVLTIGTVSEGGTCERCGGRRARPACKCRQAHEHEQDAGQPDAGSPRSGVRLAAPEPGRGRRIRTATG